ncbi:MAG: flagellum-specific ATP synthase FliI, partial [Pseudomonadales bacterium]
MSSSPSLPSLSALADRLEQRAAGAPRPPLLASGALTGVTGLTLEASGCALPLGARCRIETPGVLARGAEVVGFRGGQTFLMPVDGMEGLRPGSRVVPAPESDLVPVGEALLGRVVDALGRPLDGAAVPPCSSVTPLHGRSLNPLRRSPVTDPLDVGVRAINALLTVGRGQRLGLFAGSGVGKSVLLGMMTRFT